MQTYVDRYRHVFRVRLLTIAGLSLAVGFSFSIVTAVAYLVSCYAAFGLYIWAVEFVARRLDDERARARLKLQSTILDFLVALPSVGLALYVNAAEPTLHIECQLLIVTLVLLGGLQVHLTKAGLLLSITPSMAGLVFVSLPDLPAGTIGAHLWGGGLFAAAVLAASWRQNQSDKQSAEEAAELAARNIGLEIALADAQEQRGRAEAANRAKTELLAVASHGVRTPLNAVLTMAGVLSKEAATPRQAQLAGGIEAAGAMLLRLVNGILDFTKFETGKEELHLAPIDLAALLIGMTEVWRPECAAAGVELRLEIEGGREDLIVAMDCACVEQSVVHLLSNAVRHSAAGDAVRIRCLATPDGAGSACVRVEVIDSGPGVPAGDRARIFQPFEQTDAGRAAGGAGMGLAIVRSNVERLGGRYGVEGRSAGGSVFWFEIDATAARLPAASGAEPKAGRDHPMHILAADDHPANRDVMRLILEPLDASLDLVENGAEAVSAAESASYDVILMDAKMPVMDGETAIRQIRSAEALAGHRTPIVMVTANMFPEDVERYLAAGADRVLGKPIDIPGLYACLEELCEASTDTSAEDSADPGQRSA